MTTKKKPVARRCARFALLRGVSSRRGRSMMGMASNPVVRCAKALCDFRRKNRGEAKQRLPPRYQLPRYPVGVVECDYGVRFFLASLKADSSSSTRSRRTRSTQLSRLLARCKRARKAARTAKSPGMEREAGLTRLTRTGASQAESFSDCEITRRSMDS